MKPDAVPQQRSGSYQDILRSTALIGASSVVVMFLSLVRMKAVAMLLGPAGIGLFALWTGGQLQFHRFDTLDVFYRLAARTRVTEDGICEEAIAILKAEPSSFS